MFSTSRIAAARMAPAARLSTRAIQQRRNATFVTNVRKWAQGFEPHPFERIPITQNAQAGDYSKMVKRAGTGMMFFVPSAVVLLGWPYASAKMLNGHI